MKTNMTEMMAVEASSMALHVPGHEKSFAAHSRCDHIDSIPLILKW